MTDESLRFLVAEALARTVAELQADAPHLATRVSGWMRDLAGGQAPEEYFLHPDAFPFLLLPWWLEARIAGAPDPAFQSQLAYSSANAYYFIRLNDDVMDHEASAASGLLPAGGVFCANFLRAYQEQVASDVTFGDYFTRTWRQAAEATYRDSAAGEITADEFAHVTSRKLGAATIPLAAVCHRHDRVDLLAHWTELVDVLARWHTLYRDLLDWHRDLRAGVPTYVLSEARRRRSPSEPIEAWMLREGVSWAFAEAERWMARARDLAAGLGSPPLERYLGNRATAAATRIAAILPAAPWLARLAQMDAVDGIER